MPYIKPDLRPLFISAVYIAQKGELADATERILFGIKNLADSDVDGCLNYTFTQLFRKLPKLYDASALAQMVIYEVFLRHKKYQKLERITGLLGLMIIEFSRRKWNPKAIPYLEKLMNYVIDSHYIPYENVKIKDNGDLR